MSDEPLRVHDLRNVPGGVEIFHRGWHPVQWRVGKDGLADIGCPQCQRFPYRSDS